MTKYRWIFVSFSYPIIRTIIRKTKEVLYLRWNERHLRTYFEMLMTIAKLTISITSGAYLQDRLC